MDEKKGKKEKLNSVRKMTGKVYIGITCYTAVNALYFFVIVLAKLTQRQFNNDWLTI